MNLARLFNTKCKLGMVLNLGIDKSRPSYCKRIRMVDYSAIVGHRNDGKLNPDWSPNWNYYLKTYKR